MPRKSRLKLPPLHLGGETIGQRIARLRKERGYTQVQLAEKIGIVQNLVSVYERDKLRLHAEMVTRFAQALDVPTDEIIGTKISNEHVGKISLRLMQRMRKLEDLPPLQQKTLLKTIDTFLEREELRRTG